jgi:hypothetical protein
MVRFRIEAVITILLAALAIITLIWPDWIEITLGADPDGGSGETEWGVVIMLGIAALIVGLLARRDYRRATLTRVLSLGANG